MTLLRYPILLLLLMAPPRPSDAGWISDCMACERALGGNSVIGPFDTEAECIKWRQKNLDNNYPYSPCRPDGRGGGSAASSSSSSLQESTSQALAHGLVHGNAEALGLGMLGLGTMAMLNSGSSGPSPAQQAAQRQAELDNAARYQAQQAAKKRKFEAEKAEVLDELGEGGGSDSVDGDDELKDVYVGRPKKKKFKPPRLKPMANPLRKQPRPEDSSGGTLFSTWEQAKAFAGAQGGTIAREAGGKIAWCGEGFPYYCAGDCYTEAALNDFRIPCDSTLRTTKPEL